MFCHHLSPSCRASGGPCFVIVASPRHPNLYFNTIHVVYINIKSKQQNE